MLRRTGPTGACPLASLRASVGGVVRAPRGPNAVVVSLPGRPCGAGLGPWPLSGRPHLGARPGPAARPLLFLSQGGMRLSAVSCWMVALADLRGPSIVIYSHRKGQGTRRTAWAPKGKEPRPNTNKRKQQKTHPHETGGARGGGDTGLWRARGRGGGWCRRCGSGEAGRGGGYGACTAEHSRARSGGARRGAPQATATEVPRGLPGQAGRGDRLERVRWRERWGRVESGWQRVSGGA
jgi:hypothetical protein